MTSFGLGIQLGAIVRMAVLRHHHDNDDWEHLPIFRKWRMIETLAGGVAVFSVLPFGIAEAPELAVGTLIAAMVFFAIGTFVGGGEGEGAN